MTVSDELLKGEDATRPNMCGTAHQLGGRKIVHSAAVEQTSGSGRTSPFLGKGGKDRNRRIPAVNRAIGECSGLSIAAIAGTPHNRAVSAGSGSHVSAFRK
jgi:hypothetical protein